MSFNEDITKLIEKKRNVKPTTMKAYLLNLNKIMKLVDVEPTINNLDKCLKNPEKVMDSLSDKKSSTIRNYLASIVVYLSLDEKNDKLVDIYRKLMDKYQKENNENIANNKKSDKQEQNWASLSELRKILQTYKKDLDRTGALKKDELNKKDFDTLQKWVVGNLYIGDEENPPLRNDYIMDIISLSDYNRLSEDKRKKQNFLVVKNKLSKFFSLGEFKTSDKFGIKEITVGKTLNKVLNVWLKYNKTKHLILNSKGEPISPNSLTKLLIKVFEPTGKSISSSLLRSIYISEKFPVKEDPEKEEKQELASNMLHSVGVQQSIYSKK